MKKLSFLVIALIIGFSTKYACAVCSKTDIVCQKVGGTQKYRVSSAGNVEIAGTITPTGAIITSASTPYFLSVSSKTAAVPTGTPASTGLLAVDNSNLLYISTSTNPGGWQKVGAQ